MPAFKDLSGQKFGRLTAVRVAKEARRYGISRIIMWECLCDCGNDHLVAGASLRSGNTVSCGCVNAVNQSSIGRAKQSHGFCKSARPSHELYSTWQGMRNRCRSEKHRAYKNYGGRGITVCQRWSIGEGGLSPFECFLADMGPRPSRKHTIERKDVNGNYEPSNCCWATYKEQAQNKRSSHHETV